MYAIRFDNSYAKLPTALFTRLAPTRVEHPKLIAFNHALAREIGISLDGTHNDTHSASHSHDDLAAIFSGNRIPKGADPLAQAYGGHQFGNWAGQLGDGRAILLGEVLGPNAGRHDIHLKGSGPTPYSRAGDGRAWLGPVLREYVVSEAMHALGVPTTRALAAVSTGETVWREAALPGAILTRTARSHIRVGTFQLLAARQDTPSLQALFEHCVDRHYPLATSPLDFLQAVIRAQCDLIPRWMALGFIHGVMNTDNTLISGETIDYGPCAFMDHYHPMAVFSSIDHQGRYAYANQPDIITWNMAQLATALIPLMPDTDQAVRDFTAAIHAMPDLLRANWLTGFRAKLGLTTAHAEDQTLINDLLALMADQGADFTNTFHALSSNTARDHFSDPTAFDLWAARWHKRRDNEPDAQVTQATLATANPVLIPRNHRIEQMIDSALQGDFAPFRRLNTALSDPFNDHPETTDLTRPPTPDERITATFCGT